ncbi:Two-component response regulator, SAPR family, consists of REC, wHTH and BTAD domains [Cohnella sp. OV330]|uniref:response regulator n=1 Tax=Cohnella sp. OV330 TaxID=1855288 RepID=UPI0008DF3FD6|nr:response regulator [Cohnella sp. OV330]SFA74184.1 Two-component response regulator, SAPR family, consists of REC, wHTH and BTAD domains [Cohnella sp. OV330]
MKVMLVDDEPVMHLIMRKMLEKYAGLEVVGTFSDAPSATAFLKEREDVDLAFVDISMPGGSGLSFAAQVDREGGVPQIVFVTSHKDYAVDAFELSALDYLVKPVTQERLERTVHRALESRKALETAKAADAPAQTQGRVTVSALGDFAVQSERGRVKWMSGKSAELFAYLLLSRGKRISRHRLIAEIFAGMTVSNAEKYLNTAIYQLRKSLEPIGLREAVRSENDGYVLELDDAVVDYETFERETARLGKLHAGNAAEALDVERLYTGDLFGAKAYVWAVQHTERLADRYAAFVRAAAAALLETQDTAAAAKLLHKLLARNPWDEAAVALLMRKHAMERDKKGLTAQYTDYVKLLGRELGIKPSKELLLLYDSLVSGLPTSAN